ncbi:DNA translocase FtsK 4TM domain-containing protein [Elusimicrobiota bacterium]
MRLRVKSKVNKVHKKVKEKSHGYEIKGLFFLLLGFAFGYFLILPEQSGVIGNSVAKASLLVFGHASFIIPLIFVWVGITYLKHLPRLRLDTLFGLILLLSATTFLSVFSVTFDKINFGGFTGAKLEPFFSRLFGHSVSLVITMAVFLFFLSRLFKVSIRLLITNTWHKLIEDYNQWQITRREFKKQIESRKAQKTVQRIEEQKARPQVQEIKKEPLKEIKKDPPKIIVKQAPSPPPPKKVEPLEKRKEEKSQNAEETSAEINYNYNLPDLMLLSDDKKDVSSGSKEEHESRAALLTKTLKDFGIEANVELVITGPVVTRYEISLAAGVKISNVVSLTDNIGLALKSPSIRVVPIPEKAMVGVEVPNSKSSLVGLRGILSSQDYQDSKSLLTLAFGKMTDGTPYVTELTQMPHLLVAGATGSGKSVGIHSIILSILYKARPDEVKFMLIDPKRVEMPVYRKLPHIYNPCVPAEQADTITNTRDASNALKKLVRIMEMRYEKYAKETVRNIESYNEKMAETGGKKEFYIIVIIDELADLMVAASKEIEDSIQRLAQMARAVGIHLILATQRPSVNVITGVIKANFPARIAFQTTSKVDSRVILDTIGAEALLGKGDMLFIPPGESRNVRLQGAFVSAKETEKVVNFIAHQNIPKQYDDLSGKSSKIGGISVEDDKESKELSSALNLVKERKRISQDLLKAHFGSSARATNILSLMEVKGFIEKPEGTNRWAINFDKIDEYLGAVINSEK